MKKLATIVFKALAISYFALILLLYIFQRDLLFYPQPPVKHPSEYGLENFKDIWISASEDAPKIKAWHNDYKNRQKTIIYFHGNADNLDHNANIYKALDQAGYGVFAVSYRGYAGSQGKPSEQGLLIDAQAAIDFLTKDIDSKTISVIGRSLGTGIAVKAAAENNLDKVVLISPYTSISAVAADIYWFMPVKYLVKDKFDSISIIQNIDEQVLIIHGDMDKIVPITHAEKLFAKITAKKKFIRQEGLGHNNLKLEAIIDSIKDWI